MRHLIEILLTLTVTVGCVKKPPDPAFGAQEPLDVVVVPGCPSQEDGTLSGCQWQRVGWATLIWERGLTRHFITSGNSVSNRYIEAEALKAGMVALGVPADVIYTETQALHTDENAGFALAMIEELGFETVGHASHGGQARGMRAFFRGWGHPAVALPMDVEAAMERLQGHPTVSTEPVPEDEWLPMRKREKLIRKERGKTFRRPHSFFVYTWTAIAGNIVRRKAPEPLVPEPTLNGARHRIDRL